MQKLLLLILGLSFNTVYTYATDLDPYSRGKEAFEQYQLQKDQDTFSKIGSYNHLARPFALLHHKRTKYSALLIHGLNDSPFYVRDIAQVLYNNGFNVIAILLEGHGTKTQDMLNVSYKQWIESTNWGLNTASLLGENVIVGGFSTGGLLSVYSALTAPEIVKGLVLLAPAIAIHKPGTIFRNSSATLTCLKPSTETVGAVKESPIKYKVRTANSACQLSHLIGETYDAAGTDRDFALTSTSVKKIAQKILVPTFTALSTADERVQFKKVFLFTSNLKYPGGVIFAPNSEVVPSTQLEVVYNETPLKHSYLAAKSNPYNDQFNPQFEKLEEALKRFLFTYFK